MIRLTCFEVEKLLRQRSFLAFLLCAFLLNFVMLAYRAENASYPIQAYDDLQNELFNMPEQERYLWIQAYEEKLQAFELLQQIQNLQVHAVENQTLLDSLQTNNQALIQNYIDEFQQPQDYFTNSLEQEVSWFHTIYEKMTLLHQYPQFLQDIQDKATEISSISIFVKERSFAKENIRKTARDYQSMSQIKPILQLDEGIMGAIDAPFTDLILVLIACSITVFAWTEEKQQGRLALVRSTHLGNWRTMAAKLLAITSILITSTIILYTGNLLLMDHFCPLGDLSAPLVSLPMFYKVPVPITILSFLILYTSTKMLVLCFLAGAMQMIAVCSKQRITCCFWIVLILCIEYITYQMIPANSMFHLFKQLNMIHWLNTISFLGTYLNLNLFTTPVSQQYCSFVILIIGCISSWISCCVIYQKKQIATDHPIRFAKWRSNKHYVHHPSLHLWTQELYQFAWIEKGAICLILLGLQWFSYQDKQIFLNQDEQTWMQIMEQMQGKSEEEITLLLHQQQLHFAQLHEQLDQIEQDYQAGNITQQQKNIMQSPLETQLFAEPVFQRVQEQFTYVQAASGRKLLTPFGYEKLFLSAPPMLTSALLMTAILLFCFSAIPCILYQNHINDLIQTTSYGRSKLLKQKYLFSLCAMIPFYLLSFSSYWMLLFRTFGFPELFASITSMSQFSSFPESCSIFSLFLLQVGLQLLACSIVLLFLFLLYRLCKKQRDVICLSFLVLLMPLLLSYLEFSFFDHVSLQPLFCSTLYFAEGNGIQVLLTLVQYSLILLCGLIYVKKMNNSENL